MAGEIVTGKPVRQACRRHLRDLDEGAARGLVWRPERAQLVIEFFREVLLLEDGRPFVLQPSQEFIAGSLFGWYEVDNTRRFRTAYIETGKGSGKTPFAAGLGVAALVIDSRAEPGAEIYSAAVTREQASICFTDAKRMVEASPALRTRVLSGVRNLAKVDTASFFRPVSSEHRGLDGKRVAMAIIDELHEHPSAIVVDKMQAGTKARKNPLILEITNSGYDRNSVCWVHHQQSLSILNGSIENDAWFAYVATLDPCVSCAAEGKTQPTDDCPDCDNWRDPATWVKANPTLGTVLPDRYLREQVQKAIEMPSQMNLVRRLNFCQWTEQATKWIQMEAWDSCNLAPITDALQNRPCFAGLDLSSTTDLTAFVLVFPPVAGEDYYTVKPFFFMPETNIERRKTRDHVDYAEWIRQRHIFATEGNIVDHEAVRACISGVNVLELIDEKRKDGIVQRLAKWGLPPGGLSSLYKIQEIAVDRALADQIEVRLQDDGETVVRFGQGFLSMNAPTKDLEKLYLSKRINHGGNPVLRWMANNVAIRQDPAGNIKPDKERSTERIDGVVALVMALGRALVQQTAKRSIYETRPPIYAE